MLSFEIERQWVSPSLSARPAFDAGEQSFDAGPVAFDQIAVARLFVVDQISMWIVSPTAV